VTRIVLFVAFAAVTALSTHARADTASGLLTPALASPIPEDLDLFKTGALDDGGGDDDGPHPDAFRWGLLCPGGGQMTNGDWFAAVGVAATTVILGGTGGLLLSMAGDPAIGVAPGLITIGVGVLIWLAAAIEASLGGACLGNCLGACLVACGVASMIPDGGSSRRRRRVIDQQGPSEPAPSRSPPPPSPQRPTPYRPTPPASPAPQ